MQLPPPLQFCWKCPNNSPAPRGVAQPIKKFGWSKGHKHKHREGICIREGIERGNIEGRKAKERTPKEGILIEGISKGGIPVEKNTKGKNLQALRKESNRKKLPRKEEKKTHRTRSISLIQPLVTSP